jgi:hypothetical protein
MPALKPSDRKQEARPCDEIDSENSSEGNERRQFTQSPGRGVSLCLTRTTERHS